MNDSTYEADGNSRSPTKSKLALNKDNYGTHDLDEELTMFESRCFDLVVVVLALSGCVLAPVIGRAGTLPAGFDMFKSDPNGLSTFELGTDPSGDNPLLPAGFFGSKNGTPSDPFAGMIQLMGNPVGPMGMQLPEQMFESTFFSPHGNVTGPDYRHAVEQVMVVGDLPAVDTKVERKTDVKLQKTIGAMVTIPIEMNVLSMQSLEPVEVTFGSEPSLLFNVFVELDPERQQVEGRMKLTVTNITRTPGNRFPILMEGDINLGNEGDPVDQAFRDGQVDFFSQNPDALGLPVTYVARFVDADDPSNVFEVGNMASVLHAQGTFMFPNVPEPSSVTLIIFGLLGLLICFRRPGKGV